MDILGSFKSLFGSTSAKVDLRERYEFMREAISGTMSKFYMARDRQTGAVVGLKILDPTKTAAFEARFPGLKKPGEGEILSKIRHPHIVELLEYGLSTQNESYLVMEFLTGPGMNSLIIGKNPILDGRRVGLLRQAAEALAAVHEAEFIHRDICPRNFVVAEDAASLKLIDFGLTVPATPPFMAPRNRTGTPNYMAPELVRRKDTDQRLDIFSFGVSAYELCTFHLPWERGTTGQVAMTHAAKPVEIERYRPDIHPKLSEAIGKCIEPDRNKRLKTMREFLRAIKDVESENK